MSNRYKRIHTLAPKYQEWIAGVTEQYIHNKGLLTVQLLRIETLYHLLRYNLKQIKKLKYKILKIIQDVATTLVVLWGGGEEKIEKSCKKGSLCKYECVCTVINVQIPPQTVSATLYLEPEYKSFFFFPNQYLILLLQ